MSAGKASLTYEEAVFTKLQQVSRASLSRNVPVSSEGRGRKMLLDAVLTLDDRKIGVEVRQRAGLAEYRGPVARLLQAMGAHDITEGLIITDEPEAFGPDLPPNITVLPPGGLGRFFGA